MAVETQPPGKEPANANAVTVTTIPKIQLTRLISHLERLRVLAAQSPVSSASPKRTSSTGTITSASSRWSVASSSSTSSTLSEALPKTPEIQPKTLADLLAQPGLKRKRSITHFEGIPIELVLPPPASAPENRKFVSSRRMKELEKAMAALCKPQAPVKDHEMSDNEGVDDSDNDSDDDDLIIIM